MNRVVFLIAITVTAGCGRVADPSLFDPTLQAGAAAIVRSGGPALRVLHSFGAGKDGKAPQAALLDLNGTLFGTTPGGGAFTNGCNYGCGTLFSIVSGTEQVVHSFGEGTDGAVPVGTVISKNGTLFGTTQSGGNYCAGSTGCGTVFSVDAKGNEQVIHSFGGSGDGASPDGALLDVDGTLYGTTDSGGKYAGGTVFSIQPDGSGYKLLHSFGNGSDGAQPRSGLLYSNGAFYGTTYAGGSRTCFTYYGGCGTIFAMSAGGAERVLYRFNSYDGALPSSALIEVNGTLFGTASNGGVYGQGVVFSISPSGSKYRVLHNFGSLFDGSTPVAGLVASNRMFYGTTAGGGGGGRYGYGTIFEISQNGSTYRQLHTFDKANGYAPGASLIVANSTLYGTAASGGRFDGGTAFSFTL